MPSFRTRRRVSYTPEQMFDLVAAVERYPEFVPLCQKLVVEKRETVVGVEVVTARMTVGYKQVHERFTSRVTLDRANLTITTALVEGPFRTLRNKWRLVPSPGGCEVEFELAYEFSSMLLEMLMGGLFDRVFRKYADAFERRAGDVYGAAAGVLTPAG